MGAFIDDVTDCELQQVRMARYKNNSEALDHTIEFELAKLASRYINVFMSCLLYTSRCV